MGNVPVVREGSQVDGIQLSFVSELGQISDFMAVKED